jgi:uncharacterized protein YegJ (DUF2314 family)
MAKTLRTAILSIGIPLLLIACGPSAASSREAESKGDPIINVEQDDAEMNAAKAEARRTLPEFLGVLANPPQGVSDIGFKYPLGDWEHIWVDKVKRDGNYLTGTLANEPVQEKHFLGDKVRVPLSAVSDWGYRGSDGVMQGHRTTRVLLSRMSDEEAVEVKAYLGW